ncbi:MAG: 30S ribosomal protein S13 [Candidatus Kerfeldbacteria bacterium]|nr:30S ribosomal protein S13 [Candidatus Kerfeldbacteria bacterium]
MAVRIAGVTLPQQKQLEIALMAIYGIGRNTARRILGEVGLPTTMKAQELSEEQANKLRSHIEHGPRKIEGDLRRELVANIRRLKDIGSYRGSRHAKKLPARGQRTKTNSRSVRGNVRRTMGSGRKPPSQKT